MRKHIDAGKKATEAFRLVAEETGRSTATVQTAYYRVARSLPDGGGVQLRPRKKTAARARRPKTASAGRRAGSASRAPAQERAAAAPARAAGAARQLSDAAEALVAHITRLESELADVAQGQRAPGRDRARTRPLARAPREDDTARVGARR